jgi:hypothetical protein
MAAENDRNGEAAWQDYFHPPPSDYGYQSTSLPPRSRRDGYDYRRPAMLSPQGNAVIDLTNEPEDSPQETRPPFPGPLHTPHPHRRRIEFPRDLMNRESPADDHPPVIDLEAETPSDPSGDVLYVGTTSIRPDPIEPRWLDNNSIPMHYRHTQRPRPRRPGHGPQRRAMTSLHPMHNDLMSVMATMPTRLDYRSHAFPYNSPSQPASQPPQDRYKAPSLAPEGFTRVLAEDNVPTCPNCQEELGAGEGLKQQIHIAKPCGHVSIEQIWTERCIKEANNLLRPTVASVPAIGPFRSPKRQLQKASHFQSARLQVVINL